MRLDTGAVLNSSRQTMPYPAFGWDWVCMQSYGWVTPHHIHVFELIACFNYLRAVILRYDFHGLRFSTLLIAWSPPRFSRKAEAVRKFSTALLEGYRHSYLRVTFTRFRSGRSADGFVPITGAVACGPVSEPMPRPRKRVLRLVQATHLKYLGVSAVTTRLYLHAVYEVFNGGEGQAVPFVVCMWV